VAFLGAGLGELFRREGRLVLADPLERTGAMLPLLPLLAAFWIEPKPGEDVVFLALTGALYATLSLLRSSAGFAALAALAFNGALWAVLGRRDGPRPGRAPAALGDPAGRVRPGRRVPESRPPRRGPDRDDPLRRLAGDLPVLDADIVLTGVAQAPWLPLALAALAIAGIFAGLCSGCAASCSSAWAS
jgi:hypothetical protein